MKGLAVILLLSAMATAAGAATPTGLRVWSGKGGVAHAGKRLIDVGAVQMLQLPNGRTLFTTMTKPVIYGFSGPTPERTPGDEQDYEVDTLTVKRVGAPLETQHVGDTCHTVMKPGSDRLQNVTCGAAPSGTFMVMEGDGSPPFVKPF